MSIITSQLKQNLWYKHEPKTTEENNDVTISVGHTPKHRLDPIIKDYRKNVIDRNALVKEVEKL